MGCVIADIGWSAWSINGTNSNILVQDFLPRDLDSPVYKYEI